MFGVLGSTQKEANKEADTLFNSMKAGILSSCTAFLDVTWQPLQVSW